MRRIVRCFIVYNRVRFIMTNDEQKLLNKLAIKIKIGNNLT